jgi:ATP-dependent RNA helicase DDX24/MAK5
LYSEGEPALVEMHSTLRFFVLDEADRMIENGHFRELDSILETLKEKKYVLACLL